MSNRVKVAQTVSFITTNSTRCFVPVPFFRRAGGVISAQKLSRNQEKRKKSLSTRSRLKTGESKPIHIQKQVTAKVKSKPRRLPAVVDSIEYRKRGIMYADANSINLGFDSFAYKNNRGWCIISLFDHYFSIHARLRQKIKRLERFFFSKC